MARLNAHRKEKVHHIHEAQNQVAHFSLVVAIAGKHQCASNDVMSEHLRMVFPPFFNMDDQYLLHPERELDKVIPFE